jgi:heptosyltransferase I
MNILIVKLSAVGDVVHTLPALAELRKQYPQAHITWAVEEAAADLLAGHPHLDRVLVSGRKRWLQTWAQTRTRQELLAFLQALRDRPYDLVIDFHGLFKSAILSGLSGGRRRLGYDSPQEGSCLFYNEKIPEDMQKHAVDRYLDFVRYLGAAPGRPGFLIAESRENRERIAHLLGENGLVSGRDPFIAVNPVALWATKLWEQKKFAELCRKITEAMHTPVVLTGSAAEKPYMDAIQASMGAAAVNLAGRTSLRDLAALYRQAALLVTTDSGPMHIAAAVGTPVIALFGPTDPGRTGPYGEGHRVIRSSMPCSPCFLKQCDSCRCMNEISVDDVFDAVEKKMIEGRTTKRWEKEEGSGNQ